jgi:hypothetical protein
MSAAENMSRLLLVAELRFERCGEDLARIEREAAALRAEAERIRAYRSDPEARLALRGAAAGRAADFETWRDLRLGELGTKLAEVAAAREAQLAVARRAFGRIEALRRLSGQDRRG